MQLAMPPRKGRRARKPLGVRKQRLAADYLPFALAIARDYWLRWPALRWQFESAAHLAITEAAGSFNAARGVKFPTFAKRRIVGAMQDVQRELLPLGHRNTGDPAAAPKVASFSELPPALADNLAARHRPGSAAEDLDDFEDWLRELPGDEAEACRAAFLRNEAPAGDAARTLDRALHRLRGGSWPAADGNPVRDARDRSKRGPRC